MRKTLTDKGVQALKARPKRYAYPDPELRGHYVRVQPSGAKAFVAVSRDPAGKQIWANVGAADVLSIDDARKQARSAIARIRAGQPAFEAPVESFESVARQWLERHAQKNRLRSEKQITRLLQSHVFPFWKGRTFLGIKRSDVAALLDGVQDNHGARQADLVLTIVRSIMNWFATRNDDYHPPIIRGMRRQNPKEQTRKRILSDDEIRTIWKTAEDSGTFGAIVRMCLLTAQRNGKVSTMRWVDISADGEWTIPKEAREKDSGGVLVLPEAALAIIRARHQIGDNPYVFASVRGDGPFRGFSATKLTFDSKLPPDLPGWVIHDLRRTARSLMSRAGVLSEHAERVMGHALAGVEGVYDRHSYRDEKADALRRLAALIDGIVHPRPNVLPLTKRAKSR